MAKQKKKYKKIKKLVAKQFANAPYLGMQGGLPPQNKAGFFEGIEQSFRSDQGKTSFMIGALVGATTAYILSDEEARKKLMTGAVELYSTVLGGLAEFKEQLADIKAEHDFKVQGEN